MVFLFLRALNLTQYAPLIIFYKFITLSFFTFCNLFLFSFFFVCDMIYADRRRLYMPTSKAFHYYFKSLRYNQMKIYAGCSFEAHSTVLHSHKDFYEIILITNGSYQHTINGITTTIPQNTLMLFTPGAVHQMFSEPLQAIHFVICVEQNYFEQFVAQHFPDFHLDEHTNFYSKTISRERAQYIESLGKTICRKE